MNRKTIAAAMALALLGGAAMGSMATTPAAGRGESKSAVQRGDEVRMIARARARGTSMHAKGDYRERGRRTRLNVEVRQGTPGDVLDVAINGNVIGQITVGPLGSGKLELHSNDGRRPPVIEPGDTLTVGPATGTFAVR